MMSEQIIAAVRAELRSGGKPTATYLDLHAEREISRAEAVHLTNEILINYENRLCELEAATTKKPQ